MLFRCEVNTTTGFTNLNSGCGFVPTFSGESVSGERQFLTKLGWGNAANANSVRLSLIFSRNLEGEKLFAQELEEDVLLLGVVHFFFSMRYEIDTEYFLASEISSQKSFNSRS